MASRNRRMFELRLGKLGIILFIGGMSLLLFGLFLLGVMVGKHLETYPDQYARGVPDLLRERFFPPPVKGQGADKVRQEGQEGTDPEGETFDLTFFDTLAGKKRETKKAEPVRPEKPEAAQMVSAPPVAAVPASPTGATAETPGAPALTGTGIRPPPVEGAQRREGVTTLTPAAPPPPRKGEALPGKGGFEIQAASYREKTRADQLAQKLAGFGFSAQVVMRDIPEKGRWYRVIAGGFESREKAQGAADQMAGKVKGLKCVVRATGKED